MSIKASKIFECIESTAPRRLADDWDNVGLSVGSYHQQVNSILTTLDVTEAVIDEAIALNADMILSHHPFIFKGLKRICDEDYRGKLIHKLIVNHIGVYSAHTNLDMAEEGLNTAVAALIGIKDHQPLDVDVPGCAGVLSEVMSAEAFVEHIKRVLGIDPLRTAGTMPRSVFRAALCTGSGAEYMHLAKKKKADVYITGDVKYHDAQRAVENGLWIIDAGHFATEKYAGQLLKDILRKGFSEDELTIYVSQASSDYFHYV